MKNRLTRRSFAKRSALAAGVFASAPFNILNATNAGEKVRFVQIGCGGRGMAHLEGAMKEHLVGLVEVDDNRPAAVRKWMQAKGGDADKIQVFTDYRRMFDAIRKDIDAVFIATPNHQHALPAMIAMQLGKGVYCEKPVCHDIGEARKLREMARKYKVTTQMGNQGHCMEGYHLLCEYVWAGTIGKITETHS